MNTLGLNGWRKQLFKTHNHCQWCKDPISPKSEKEIKRTRWNTSTIDHIIARSKGGSDDRENLKVSCLRCNNGREMFNDCIGAFACASAIVGKFATLQEIQNKCFELTKSKNAIKRNERRLVGYRPDRRFYYINPIRLTMDNKAVETFTQKSSTKILYEGTQAFSSNPLFMKTRTNQISIHKNNRVYNALINDGYDAVWLLKRGLIVINPDAFATISNTTEIPQTEQ